MSNERKLMPYEHQLVDALGISKQEYLDFVAQQQLYSDPKEGTILDIRNDPTIVALVLVIVGTILQVIGSLLLKEEDSGRTQTRDEVFAPRSGFNSVQKLADYGDPVHLVYTDINTNKQGGVRVTTSLLWSAVKSFGSSQYVKLLLLIGAGGIGEIDPGRSAFGQTPLRDLIVQNYWLYFKPNGTGSLYRNNLLQGSEYKNDPGTDGAGSNAIYRINPIKKGAEGDGFSHAISPSTSNVFGMYSPVPINVEIEVRWESGYVTRTNNEIHTNGLSNWGQGRTGLAGGGIAKGEVMYLFLSNTNFESNWIAALEAAESRRAASNAFDQAGVMKLGSARFSIVSMNRGSTDDGTMTVKLVCTDAGRAPSTFYGATDPQLSAQVIANADPTYLGLRATVNALLDEDQRHSYNEPTTAEALLNGFGGRPGGTIYHRVQQRYIRPGVTSLSYRVEFKRYLTENEKQSLRDYIAYNNDIATGKRADDVFFTKALVKIEIAKYETVSPCHIVDFAIKARVWRRIGGRQEFYGSKRLGGYPTVDNGLKRRSSMFIVKYKKEGAKVFDYVKGIFVVARAADIDNFIYFRFHSAGPEAFHWQFEIEPIHDSIAEFGTGRLTASDGGFRFFYLENAGSGSRINLETSDFIAFTGQIVYSSTKLPPRNNSPRDTKEWDLFSNTADTQVQFSFDQGPEFILTAVTEQITERFNDYPELYSDLSLAGFNMYSGRNVQDLRSLSMFVNKGRRCRLLRTSGIVNGISWGQPDFGPHYLPPNKAIGTSEMVPGTSYYITVVGSSDWATAGLRKTPAVGEVFVAKAAVAGTGQVRAGGHANRAPDIFLDTILDGNDGIGKYSGDLFAIDLEQLARSKKFCERNKLFMDGLIAEPESWRQFWANNAPFSLLELAKIDGREALIPGVPYEKSSGKIASKETLITVPIAALFNQGNILEGSYKEEFIDYGTSTEDVIVTIIYRDNERDGAFPRKNSVEIKLKSANEDSALRETIDASQFVTNKAQAILLGKLLCQTRRNSRRAIEFKTFPTDSYVGPSAYIYVELAQNQWDKIYSGTIGKGGELNLPLADAVKDGDYQFLLYNPNSTYSEGAGDDRCPGETEDNKKATGTLFKSAIAVVNGRAEALKGLEGYVFVLGKVVRGRRTFRVTEVSMDEEGEVTVRAVEHPTDEDGYSLITKGLASDDSGLFRIDGRAES
jgi:hypothetical protein